MRIDDEDDVGFGEIAVAAIAVVGVVAFWAGGSTTENQQEPGDLSKGRERTQRTTGC